MLKILIVDDHAVVRKGVVMTLRDEFGDVQFIEAKCGNEALAAVKRHKPNMAILDISLPGRGGLDLIRDLKVLKANLSILVYSMHPEEHFARRVLKLGAAGYLSKEQSPAELVNAVRKLLKGGKYISAAFADQFVMDWAKGSSEKPHENLSDREFQVLRMIANGRSIKDIAGELSLSGKTISTYQSRIMQKMSLRTSADLVRYAIENKLIT